jgi:hypothetical protein
MPVKGRSAAFSQGVTGEGPEVFTCAECGYTSDKRKNFRRQEIGHGHVCSTGHYTDKSGELKRQKNLYARR